MLENKFVRLSVSTLLALAVINCAAPQKTSKEKLQHSETPAPPARPVPDKSPKPDPVIKQSIPETNLKADERVLVFPTNAVFDPQSNQWQIHIHGWVFEPEKDSVWRHGLTRSLAFLIGAKPDTPEGRRFEERSGMFLVDNERNKSIVLNHGDHYFQSPKTGANGHFEFSTTLKPGKHLCQDWLALNLYSTYFNHQIMPAGSVQCVTNDGISVISDIDDTIKNSNVLDKKKLLKKTFLKEFSEVTGMPELYQAWKLKGYQFHYVSSSPWQLYPALSEFIQKKSFPKGSMHLKLIRVKDKSIFNLFASPEEGKVPTITKLLNDYPQRRFILVGDSGEKDPEIYANIARQYPQRIVRIYIRDVKNDRPALVKIFQGLPKTKWVVFQKTTDLKSRYARLYPELTYE